MAECKQCGFHYANGSKCGNCGSTDPKGSVGGVLLVVVLFFGLAGMCSKDDPNSNSKPTPAVSQPASTPASTPQPTQRLSPHSPSPSHSAQQKNQIAPTKDSSQNSSQYPLGRLSGNSGYLPRHTDDTWWMCAELAGDAKSSTRSVAASSSFLDFRDFWRSETTES
jgi:hypothetical protein